MEDRFDAYEWPAAFQHSGNLFTIESLELLAGVNQILPTSDWPNSSPLRITKFPAPDAIGVPAPAATRLLVTHADEDNERLEDIVADATSAAPTSPPSPRSS